MVMDMEDKLNERQDWMEDDELVIDLSVFFSDLWIGFKKFWWIFLVICSVMASLNFYRVRSQYQPMYESKVSFTVSTLVGYDEANTSYGFYYNQSTAEQMANLFPYVLQSDVMKGLIQEELHTNAINGSVSAKAVPNSNLFTMRAVSSSPELSKQILNATLKHLPSVTKYIIGSTKLNIIQPVTTPDIPSNVPNYRKQVVMGVLVGVGISCVWLGLYALFRKTIRKEADFKEILNLKCLGCIPFVTFKEHKKKEIDRSVLVSNSRISRMFVDSIQELTLRIGKLSNHSKDRVFMFTSAIPNEGKSTVCANTAYMMADYGKKVLLLDLDLRNCSLKDILHVQTDFDFENVKTIRECMVQVEENLYYMDSPKISSDKISEILTSSMLKKNLEELRKEFDYIFVDVPPCGVINDALIVSSLCDATIFVIRQDVAKQSQIIDAMQRISSQGTPIVGGVLNGISGSFAHSGYHSYGYRKYGYGYKKYGSEK